MVWDVGLLLMSWLHVFVVILCVYGWLWVCWYRFCRGGFVGSLGFGVSLWIPLVGFAFGVGSWTRWSVGGGLLSWLNLRFCCVGTLS